MTFAQVFIGEDEASLDELMDAIGTAVVGGLSVSEAVDQVLPNIVLTRDLELEMIRIGVIQFTHDRQHSWRRARNDNKRWSFEAKFMNRPLTGASARADVLRRISLVGAAGYPKSLLAFQLADCEHFIDVATGQIKGWSSKRTAMQTAASKLHALGTDQTIADLPVKELNEVADAFDEAWP